MKKYDLCVIGSGFAGTAAAVAAARCGASVLLLDKSNTLGGAATNCLVNPFMKYWTVIDGERCDLSRGIFTEIWDELARRKASTDERRDGFSEETLKRILYELTEAAGVDLLFHAYLFKVNKNGERIESVAVATVGGEITIEADYFIDATGDAQVAFLAGLETTLGREPDHLCQPMTLNFRVANVDVEKFMASRDALNKKYAEYLADGKFINPRENILVFKTPHKNVLHFNTTRVVRKNPTNAWEVTEAEIIARKQVYEVFDFMKEFADGMEDAYLLMTASEIGVRESRMIIGDYVLTEADCKGLKKFDDAIAACNYDIDIHNPEGTGTSHYYFKDGDYYTIPYRSLIPKGASNMLVAGRCISSDHGAQASYRIMPTVCTIGEAAGTAIALAKRSGVDTRGVDIKELQRTLVENGAFIG